MDAVLPLILCLDCSTQIIAFYTLLWWVQIMPVKARKFLINIAFDFIMFPRYLTIFKVKPGLGMILNTSKQLRTEEPTTHFDKIRTVHILRKKVQSPDNQPTLHLNTTPRSESRIMGEQLSIIIQYFVLTKLWNNSDCKEIADVSEFRNTGRNSTQ